MNLAEYFAVVRWAPVSPRVQRAIDRLRCQSGLTALLDLPSLLFLGDPSARFLAPPGRAEIIWGYLFDRRSSRFVVRDIDTELSAEPERFMSQFWGGYIRCRSAADHVEIFRDPSGVTRCYVAQVDGAVILTSRPKSLIDLDLVRLDLDLTVMTQALAFRDIRPARTALRGISELLPGMRLRIGRTSLRDDCIWSPWSFAGRTREFDNFDEAARAVRESVLQVSKSWAGAFERPIVELSGGLDSSIVAASLAQAGADPLCVTFNPAPGDSDERPFARALATHLGARLEEVDQDVAAVDLTASHAAELPRPCARSFQQALDGPLSRLAADRQANAFFSGGGGDHVFCHLQSALPVIDFARRKGLGRSTLAAVMTLAEVGDVTFWEALRATLRRSVERDRTRPKPRTNRYVARAALADLPWPAGLPWFDAPSAILPGKRRHAWALGQTLNHMEGFAREAAAIMVSPLLSQPVVELCLRVPTWRWIEGGRNRAVAREAFRQILPTAIVERRTKGGFDSLGASIIRRNVETLRAMLLDGFLAKNDLIDRPRLEADLRVAMTGGEAVAEILSLADVEAWAAIWERRRSSAAVPIA